MFSFDCWDNISSGSNHSLPTGYKKCQCPSYLKRVAPPREYSSIDLRNMISSKMYEVRNTRSGIINSGHRINVASKNPSEESFKDVKSTKQNVNEVKNSTDEAIDVYENHSSETKRRFDDLSLGRKKLGKNYFWTNDEKSSEDESFRGVTKIEVINETIKKNRIGHDSKCANNDNLNCKNVETKLDTSIQIEEESNSNDDNNSVYDYDDQEKNIKYTKSSRNRPLLRTRESFSDLEIFKKCNICKNISPLSENDWEEILKFYSSCCLNLNTS
ncbi:Hypothetical protein CINCED_3A005742 [Cinara cedri]|uniref:Uncharacterized protein n=1 Tax=Cinara cedri TaxID=506608 RepID=A0A5E4NQA6_9HEMI|nr:Hypothetical protein CINCED_3A005742 [Cinara cedri]